LHFAPIRECLVVPCCFRTSHTDVLPFKSTSGSSSGSSSAVKPAQAPEGNCLVGANRFIFPCGRDFPARLTGSRQLLPAAWVALQVSKDPQRYPLIFCKNSAVPDTAQRSLALAFSSACTCCSWLVPARKAGATYPWCQAWCKQQATPFFIN